MRVLIVEDDDRIASPLCSGLEADGFEVERFATGREALARLEPTAGPRPDVILLEVRLPDMDGFEVCKEIRAVDDVPIIIVTVRHEETDRVLGLELGADDYVVKPVGFGELCARIRAVTRRAGGRSAGDLVLTIGPLVIDRRSRRASADGTDLTLTHKEFDLLALLAERPGAVWPRMRILEEVWRPNWYGSTKTLDVHVATLRKKLGHPDWIETVRGVGLRLCVPTDR